MLAPAYTDSSQTTVALCMLTGTRHIFRIHPMALCDIAISGIWWPGPTYGIMVRPTGP